MNIQHKNANGFQIAIIENDANEILIRDVPSALDFMATVRYAVDCDRIAIPKSAVAEDFFKLSTGIAGEILQKFVNYQCKLAIFGDFSVYTSKALRDFMYESNNGNHIFFASDEEEAIAKLTFIQKGAL